MFQKHFVISIILKKTHILIHLRKERKIYKRKNKKKIWFYFTIQIRFEVLPSSMGFKLNLLKYQNISLKPT